MRNRTIGTMKPLPRPAAEPAGDNGVGCDKEPENMTAFDAAGHTNSVLCATLDVAERIRGRLVGVGPACESVGAPKDAAAPYLQMTLNENLYCAERLRKVLTEIEAAVGESR